MRDEIGLAKAYRDQMYRAWEAENKECQRHHAMWADSRARRQRLWEHLKQAERELAAIDHTNSGVNHVPTQTVKAGERQ